MFKNAPLNSTPCDTLHSLTLQVEPMVYVLYVQWLQSQEPVKPCGPITEAVLHRLKSFTDSTSSCSDPVLNLSVNGGKVLSV